MSALKITGRMVTFSRITLETNEQTAIREQLVTMSQNNPFYGTPVVLDSTVEQELIEIIQLLLSLDLQPMAVVEGILAEQAREIQFPVLPKDRAVQRIQATNEQTAIVKAPKPQPAQETVSPAPALENDTATNTAQHDDSHQQDNTTSDDKKTPAMSVGLELDFSQSDNPTPTVTSTPVVETKNNTEVSTTQTETASKDEEEKAENNASQDNTHHTHAITIEHKTSFHNMMLRTGQCLVQEAGDVILMASMNSGAEIIASGNVHIYGYARGRIIAGASGDKNARIFCQNLDAELVSIAGVFCLADDIPSHALHTSSYIYLNDEHELVFESFNPNSI